MWGWLWSDPRRRWQQVCDSRRADLFVCYNRALFNFVDTRNVSSRYCGRPDGRRSAMFWSLSQSGSVGGQQELFQGLHGASRHPHGSLRLLHRPAGGLRLRPHVSLCFWRIELHQKSCGTITLFVSGNVVLSEPLNTWHHDSKCILHRSFVSQMVSRVNDLRCDDWLSPQRSW